jgi:hypothetical protein
VHLLRYVRVFFKFHGMYQNWKKTTKDNNVKVLEYLTVYIVVESLMTGKVSNKILSDQMWKRIVRCYLVVCLCEEVCIYLDMYGFFSSSTVCIKISLNSIWGYSVKNNTIHINGIIQIKASTSYFSIVYCPWLKNHFNTISWVSGWHIIIHTYGCVVQWRMNINMYIYIYIWILKLKKSHKR